MPVRRADLRIALYPAEDLEDIDEDDPMDADLPRPGEEDIGGYAYERLYMDFRYQAPEHLTGTEVEDFLKWEVGQYYERLDEIIEPTQGDILAYNRAVKLFQRYERHGYPEEGTWRAQPAAWLHVIDCVLSAKERAMSERARWDAKVREQDSQAMQQSQSQ